MKATHNRQRQVQRKCIFCGEGGVPGNPMTFEHLWPEWMHPHLPHADEAKNIAGHHRMRMGELTVKRKVRQGHVFTHRFRVVCKKCNTGWMSQIEDDAKPILMRLITGQRFALLKKHRRILTTWITLKNMVSECIDPNDAVIDEFEREEFLLNKKIPHRMQIYIASHDLQEWHTGFWHQTLLAHLGSTPPTTAERTGMFKNIQTTTIGAGRLLTVSFVTKIPDLNFNPSFGLRKMRRLWPIREQAIVWPLPHLTLAEANRVANAIRELRDSPISRWLPYPS